MIVNIYDNFLWFRYFTHGYDFYAPGEAVLYHLYSRAHRPTIQSDTSSSSIHQEHKEMSLDIVRRMLCNDMAFDDSTRGTVGGGLAELNFKYFSLGS